MVKVQAKERVSPTLENFVLSVMRLRAHQKIVLRSLGKQAFHGTQTDLEAYFSLRTGPGGNAPGGHTRSHPEHDG